MAARGIQWCPFGRISIQRWQNGNFKEGVPGAYNLICRVDMVRGETGETLIPASPCMKEVCAFYKKGLPCVAEAPLRTFPAGQHRPLDSGGSDSRGDNRNRCRLPLAEAPAMKKQKRCFGRCSACGRKLLLNPESSLCVMCEISMLHARIVELELMLSQCRREKQTLYAKLSEARAQGVR